MIAYHEIQSTSLEAALKNGLARTSHGSKSDDQMIVKTDHFLDARRPAHLKREGVSRSNNLYAYVYANNSVIDITDGSYIPVATFIAKSKQHVLELDIDPGKCFVSDLDAYDALKAALESGEGKPVLDQLAEEYWSRVVKLDGFDPSTISRPEVMVTYDIPPDKLRVKNAQ